MRRNMSRLQGRKDCSLWLPKICEAVYVSCSNTNLLYKPVQVGNLITPGCTIPDLIAMKLGVSRQPYLNFQMWDLWVYVGGLCARVCHCLWLFSFFISSPRLQLVTVDLCSRSIHQNMHFHERGLDCKNIYLPVFPLNLKICFTAYWRFQMAITPPLLKITVCTKERVFVVRHFNGYVEIFAATNTCYHAVGRRVSCSSSKYQYLNY